MRLHIVTVGEPKLSYAKAGWDEYLKRLKHYHTVKISHIPDKWAYDADYIKQTIGTAYCVALVIDGPQLSSPELAIMLERRALEAKEVCFVIGGPEGLPEAIIRNADMQLGLSKLTFPHDLAMVVLLEALYRASTITAGLPYHK
jgi:23S rRNA (pseudouridine1915-N3)-methyltransferase